MNSLNRKAEGFVFSADSLREATSRLDAGVLASFVEMLATERCSVKYFRTAGTNR